MENQLSIELHGAQDEKAEPTREDECATGENKGQEKEEDLGTCSHTVHPTPLPRRQQLTQNRGSSPMEGRSQEDRNLDRKGARPKPRKVFQFTTSETEEVSYFSNLYERYTIWCEQYREMMDKPVQDIRNYVAEKRQSLHNAEQLAVAAASESLGGLYESLHNAEQSAVAAASESLGGLYGKLVEPDGALDRRLSALNHGTRAGLDELWSSAWEMQARLRTASALSSRRQALRNQLQGYRRALEEARGGQLRTAMQSRQMAELMRRITHCYEALEGVEASAKDAFVQVTGYVFPSLLQKGKEHPRYLK